MGLKMHKCLRIVEKKHFCPEKNDLILEQKR